MVRSPGLTEAPDVGDGHQDALGGLKASEMVGLARRTPGRSHLAPGLINGLPLVEADNHGDRGGLRVHALQGFKGPEAEAVLLVDPRPRRYEVANGRPGGDSGARSLLQCGLASVDCARPDHQDRVRRSGELLAFQEERGPER
jgi:hypothetical protein